MMKTKSVSPIWATSSGVMNVRSDDRVICDRHRRSHIARSSMCHLEAARCSPARGQRAAALSYMGLVLVTEMLQRRQHRRDRGVAERAQGLAADVARDALQQIEILHLAFAVLDLAEDLVQPVGAFAAWRALAARFVAI